MTEESAVKADIELDFGPDKEKVWVGAVNCPGEYAHELPNALRAFASAIEAHLRSEGWDVAEPQRFI